MSNPNHAGELDEIGHRKKAMVEAMEKSLGIVTTACKMVGISRQTHYNWMTEDTSYRDAINELSDMVVDFAESQLHKLIKDGNVASVLFYLKTKGKHRGYVETTELHVQEKKPLTWFTDET